MKMSDKFKNTLKARNQTKPDNPSVDTESEKKTDQGVDNVITMPVLERFQQNKFIEVKREDHAIYLQPLQTLVVSYEYYMLCQNELKIFAAYANDTLRLVYGLVFDFCEKEKKAPRLGFVDLLNYHVEENPGDPRNEQINAIAKQINDYGIDSLPIPTPEQCIVKRRTLCDLIKRLACQEIGRAANNGHHDRQVVDFNLNIIRQIESGANDDTNLTFDQRYLNASNIEQHVQPAKHLIPGFLPYDILGMFFGDSESKKTYILIYMACCLASATKFGDREVVQCIVVYVTGEAIMGTNKRVHACKAALGIAPGVHIPLYVRQGGIDLSSKKSVSGFMADMERIKQAEDSDLDIVIIFDTYDNNTTESDTDPKANKRAIDNLKIIKNRYGNVLVAHHPGHEKKNRPKGDIRLMQAFEARYWVRDAGNLESVVENQRMKDQAPVEPVEFLHYEQPISIPTDEGIVKESVLVASFVQQGPRANIKLKVKGLSQQQASVYAVCAKIADDGEGYFQYDNLLSKCIQAKIYRGRDEGKVLLNTENGIKRLIKRKIIIKDDKGLKLHEL